MRKINLHILPLLFLLYCFSFLDRTATGAARVYGLENDIGITSAQFGWTLSIFFVTYVLFEIPGNLCLKRFSPRRWLSFITLGWGAASLGIAFSNNFATLMTTRALLGLFESSMFPGSIMYLTYWYRPEERATAIARFACAAPISGFIGGLTAYGAGHIHAFGWEPWRHVILIQSAPTLLLGVIVYFMLPNEPATATFLTDKERVYAVRRLQPGFTESMPSSDDGDSTQEMWATFFCGYNLAFATQSFCFGTVGYAMSLLMPTVLSHMGFDGLTVQLLTLPSHIISFTLVNVVSWNSDRTGDRSKHVMVAAAISAIFFMALGIIGDQVRWVRYGFLIIAAIPLNSASPAHLAWNAIKIRMATVTAMLPMASNIGGIVAGQLFPAHDAPAYRMSNFILFGLLIVHVVISVGLRVYFKYANQRLARLSNGTSLWQFPL
ncbi:MFS general substrate transporter [Ramicandelaber brevisporus]|nr:MFS general substrate transporter [Ramicandelaber brevisporus]